MKIRVLAVSSMILVALVISIAGAQVLSSPSPHPSPSPSDQAALNRTVYSSHLRPVNDSGVFGDAQIVVDDHTAGISSRLFGLASGVAHQQYLYSGNVCPTSGADLNGDGYIDAVEAAKVIGMPGAAFSFQDGSFPKPSDDGVLNFIQSYSVGSFLTNLSSDGAADLNGLVLVVQGVSPSIALPATVQTQGTRSANSSLPVSCGRLSQVLE